MEWLPTLSTVVVNVATPLPLSVAVPIGFAPSVKVTDPFGVPKPLFTVAVKVTACPNVLGLSEEVSVVVVATRATVRVAVAEFPVPALVDETAPVVLIFVPAVVPVTVTLNWHCELALIVEPA